MNRDEITDSVEESPASMADALPLSEASMELVAPAEIPNTLKGWLAITSVILVAIDLRPGIVSIGPILPAIREEFGLSHAGASLLTTIPDLLMGLLALPTPWLAKRFGRDEVILAALLLLSVSILGRGFAPNTSILLLSTAGVGAGIAIAGALIAGFIKANFPTRAAVLMGIYATALSFGSTISAAATGPIAQAAPRGWRFASGSWSLLGITAIIAWGVVTFHERKLKPRSAKTSPHVPLPLRNKTAWLVALYFALNNLLFYALLAWTAPMFREYGKSPAFAGLLLASFTAAFMFGNPVFGALSKSHDRRGWLVVSAVLTAAGLVPLAIVPNLAPFLWVPLAAFGLGGGFTLGMTLPLDNTHSVHEANVWNAFVLTVGYLVAAAGPLMVGTLRDITGTFRLPIWVLVVLTGAMLALTPLLHPHKQSTATD